MSLLLSCQVYYVSLSSVMKMENKYKTLEELDEEQVVTLLKKWNLEEFIEIAKEKHIDGRKLIDLNKEIIRLWRPNINANKLITFVEDLKQNPSKYLCEEEITSPVEKNEENIIDVVDTSLAAKAPDKVDIESQYQTIPIRRKEEPVSTLSTVEELIKRIVPAKSFLYRHKQKIEKTPSYLPMDSGTPKKRKLFRLTSYEYPFFDIKSRFSKPDTSSDLGYYSMKRNSKYVGRIRKKSDPNTKYKTLSTPEGSIEYPEDHFYEDLCYNDIQKVKEQPLEVRVLSVRPCIVKIQELFQSFRVPFFKRTEMIEDSKEQREDKEKDTNIYENSDSIANMYDSVQVNRQTGEDSFGDKPRLPVEDYLEPVQLCKDYCDIQPNKQKDDSLLGYILSIFENRFGMRRETNDDQQSSESDSEHKVDCALTEETRKWPEDKKNGRTNMADRPLPVPVENEPYYMNIDREEAQNLLRGQPDGVFVLRPSSQSDHAYTLSVSCSSAVHNVGVRRRPDGRLALGFPRRGELSFATVSSLLRHHRKKRLLLVSGGDVIGATTLTDTPHYYQSPKSIPVPVTNE